MRHSRYLKTPLSELPASALLQRFATAEGEGHALLAPALQLACQPRERIGQQPHCLDVAEILRLLGVDQETLVATLLLDAYLAGEMSEAELRAEYGEVIANLVLNVQRLTSLQRSANQVGSTPEQAERLRRMLLATVDDVRAVLIKLAYRLQHLRHLADEPNEFACAIARETLEIFAPLANRLGVAQLKWEMEDLALRIMDPEAYRSIAKQLEESRTERERYIQQFTERLQNALKEEGVAGEILGRPKHIYSIWRKMQLKNLAFDELYDLRAVRVIVDRVATCYAVLGAVHSLWQHIPREFDDYIANPKDNGYQSLHTAVMGPEGKVVEVQIRTRDMDAFAELGVAAHWRYKEGGREDQALTRAIASLRRLLEADEDDRELLESFRYELFHDRVFVLTPNGDIMDLPKGSTPLDFAYTVHTEIGHRCRGAKVNGRIVPLTYALRSGERVEILTSRTGEPRRDWMSPHMGFLHTARARSKVRSWFRQQDKERNLAEGKALLEREAQRLGVAAPDPADLQKRFNQPSAEDVLVALGAGDISSAQLAAALQVPLPPASDETLLKRRRKPVSEQASSDKGIRIQGVGNLLTQMARCCHPVPGDAVIGFITQGKGVSIHRRDCRNILRLPADKRQRLIEVSWGEEPQAYPVKLHIDAFDRQGLLRDVTLVLANENVNVLDAETHTDRRENTVSMDLTLQISDTGQLSRLMDKLGALPNILAVKRAMDT